MCEIPIVKSMLYHLTLDSQFRKLCHTSQDVEPRAWEVFEEL